MRSRLVNLYFLLALLGLTMVSSTPTLQFRPDGTFVVLQLTDLHYGEDDEKDYYTSLLASNLIQHAKPDLVVITGDGMSNYAWDDRSQGFFYNNWVKLTSPFLVNKVPYAFVLGNHDVGSDFNRTQIYELDKEHPYSMTSASKNLSEYLLTIKSPNPAHAPLFMWMFDSHSTGCLNESHTWGCIEPHQVTWYRQMSRDIKHQYGENVTGSAFFHVPPPQFMDLWNFENVHGGRGEEVSCARVDTGFFSVVKEERTVQSIFCGHDHTNDFFGKYQGIELAYGRKSGVAAYGPRPGVKRGGRILNYTQVMDKATGKWRVDMEHYVLNEDLVIERQTNVTDKMGIVQTICYFTAPSVPFGLVQAMCALFVICGISVIWAVTSLFRKKKESAMLENEKSLNGNVELPEIQYDKEEPKVTA